MLSSFLDMFNLPTSQWTYFNLTYFTMQNWHNKLKISRSAGLIDRPAAAMEREDQQTSTALQEWPLMFVCLECDLLPTLLAGAA